MFVKLGSYYINKDNILYLKPSGNTTLVVLASNSQNDNNEIIVPLPIEQVIDVINKNN